eukprot:2908284-Alexandrium_andersonii.AAC.1
MSASLVGSEMCIRDRLAGRCAVGRGCGFDHRHWDEPSSTRLGMGESLRPVSYTHLTLPTICSV